LMPRLSRHRYPFDDEICCKKDFDLKTPARKLARRAAMAFLLGGMVLAPGAGALCAQEAPPAPTAATSAAAPAAPSAASDAPLRLTLADALERARHNSVQFQAAVTDAALARGDRAQARDSLLPSVNYNNSVIYTQGGGPGFPVRYIANNSVHEYISQGNVHEVLDVAGIADLRKVSALAAVARAKAEIASRGLVVTVVQNYYGALSAQAKLESSRRAAEEGQRFLKLTQDLEHGGEVAHGDVIKAELQYNERQRQLQEAQLGLLNARLDLAVLIFPNLNNTYELADDLHGNTALPALGEVQQQAAKENPEVRAALAAVAAAGHEVTASRAGYLPSLSVDYFYGIDATHFATKTDGQSNLGSSIVASLNIPIWNWGATQSKVQQSELRQKQAKLELSMAQRKLLAEMQSLYAEAEMAQNQLENLRRSSELAAESLRLTTLRYKNGESTVLEVVDAQNTATMADAGYQDGSVRYRVALANLQTLTGVLTTP
ncbi:MAG TPA: TolC family protein, partial [Candidatus Acidoferrum sp.]|nr:TolC family protein [Candidatus Acidoferrum sp.]